ncbi:MAG: SH3 domain-containing protein [Chloroflexi bacterium]|nr:SH3 domain-containing protein [Chloroflexota bacterium]
MKKTPSRTLVFSLALFVFSVAVGCSPEIILPATPASTPSPTQIFMITATLPATQTPLPTATAVGIPPTKPVAPVEGQTTSQLNVRGAPSAESEQVGTVEIFAKVQIVGKDPSNKWWMILLPESSTEKGWITTQFVQVADTSSVPVINVALQGENNAPIAEVNSTESVSVATIVPTALLASAPLDGDSAEAPAVNITLSEASVPYLNYSNDISSPEGDAGDWVKFALEGKTGQEQIVSVVVDCSGSSKLNLELLQNGVTLQSWPNITCGQQRHQLQLYLFVSAPYTLHLFPAPGDTALHYVSYTLAVQLTK